MEGAFGGDVEYAMLATLCGESPEAETRYSPAQCTGARKTAIAGDPDPVHISTSYSERSNLSMRTFMPRFTRPALGFSKKLENHCHMVALYRVWYNFAKQHESLKGLPPAMAAGVSKTLWSVATLWVWLTSRKRAGQRIWPTGQSDRLLELN